MTLHRRVTKLVVLAGITGGILVEAALFCVGSLGALGVSTTQLLLFFLAGSIVPLVLGVTGAWLAVVSGFSNPERVAFLLGFLGTMTGPAIAYVFQLDQQIPQSTPLIRTVVVLLFTLLSGVLSQLIISGVLRRTRFC
jgi:hypothetical protein